MTLKLKLEPIPHDLPQLYIYYVYGSEVYENDQIKENETVAKVIVEVTREGQEMRKIIRKKEITNEDILNLCKRSLSNLIVDPIKVCVVEF